MLIKKMMTVGLFLAFVSVQNHIIADAGTTSNNINAMPNYSNEYQDTEGWYDAGGQMIYNQPQPIPDNPDTNNSLDQVPINLPGT